MKIDKDILFSMYDITPEGDVYRIKDGHKFTPCKDQKGYYRLRLPYPNIDTKDGRQAFKVHRLVAMRYLGDYSEELQVNHKNGIKTDNRVENLEMVTNSENALHAWRVLDSTERRKKIGEITRRRNYERYKIDNIQLRLF